MNDLNKKLFWPSTRFFADPGKIFNNLGQHMHVVLASVHAAELFNNHRIYSHRYRP